jgi:hypothetical protein
VEFHEIKDKLEETYGMYLDAYRIKQKMGYSHSQRVDFDLIDYSTSAMLCDTSCLHQLQFTELFSLTVPFL